MLTPGSVLIAPVGSKPQLVTLALDLLAQAGEHVVEVVAIHTTPSRPATADALRRLTTHCRAVYAEVNLRCVCLCDDSDIPLNDVDSPIAARQAFRVLYREIRNAKTACRRVHLSIAGGRKIIAVYGMAAAQLLFDPDDRVWHLYSVPALIERQALHAMPGEAALIHVPVLRWSEVSPTLTNLILSDDPFEAMERQDALRRSDAVRAARDFIEHELSASERAVVALVVREGLTDAEVAERTCRSPKTVGHHLSSVYRKACACFGLSRADRHTLMALLSTYFAFGDGEGDANRESSPE